jgi:hypothetical protein
MVKPRRFTHEVIRFIRARDCETLKELMRNAKTLDKVNEVSIFVTYMIIEDDTPRSLRHLIPSFDEFMKIVNNCVKVVREIPEIELTEEYYRKLSSNIPGRLEPP